jgi:hypothetical protein
MDTILLTLSELCGGAPVTLLLVALLAKLAGIMVLAAYFSGHPHHHRCCWRHR